MATTSTTAEQNGEILWFSPILLPTLEARRWQRPHQSLGYVSPEQFETHNPVPIRPCPWNRG